MRPRKKVKLADIAKKSGAVIEFEEDIEKAVKGADVIYTDVWISMAQHDEVWKERINDLVPCCHHRRVESTFPDIRRLTNVPIPLLGVLAFPESAIAAFPVMTD